MVGVDRWLEHSSTLSDENFHTSEYMYVSAKRVVHNRDLHVLSLDRVFTMLLFLINNTYFCNGSVIYQQVVGIPMGTREWFIVSFSHC